MDSIMAKLSKNFTSEEFACKCGCGLNNISPELVRMLQLVRDILGIPVRITSGCRCVIHNARVGGVIDSTHLPNEEGICLAADIACPSGRPLFDMLDALRSVGFRRIGINFENRFVHVDIDPNKPQDVIFKY
jgi:uncharacterized protein YcbK (DUF882 family)